MNVLRALLGVTALSLTGGAAARPAAQLDLETQRFVDALEAKGGPPLYTLSPREARAVLEDLQSGPIAKLPAEIEDRTIPGGPTGDIGIRIVRPPGATHTLPVVLYFHGGGWILGDENTHDRLIREIANGAYAAVVFVKYTRSPEARYPIAIEQAYAATRYVAEHGSTLDVDPSRLALAGDSVGGNMVAVTMLLAKQRGGPKIRYQVMFYPVTDARMGSGSYRAFANGPWLTKAAMKWFFDAYAPNVGEREEPTISPLNASLEQLQGQAPALIVTDENDVLRDEGEAYAHELMQAGVEVTAVRELGTMHDFVMLDALRDTPAAKSAVELANRELRKALYD
jgi:acetyl esterase